MSPETAALLWLTLGAYLAVGMLFALVFVWRGVVQLDPAARDMPLSARVLIIPGASALWPWVLRRWWRRALPPVA